MKKDSRKQDRVLQKSRNKNSNNTATQHHSLYPTGLTIPVAPKKPPLYRKTKMMLIVV